MGISASYINQNGGARLFSLDGAPAPGSMAEALLGAHASQTQLPAAGSKLPSMLAMPSMEDMQRDRGVTEDTLMDVLTRKLPGNGSIVSNGHSLCLRGEEGGTPGGNMVYGSSGGRSGFFPMDQIDPGSGGIMLNGEGNRPDGSSVMLTGAQGATIRIGGRTDVRIDESTENAIRWLEVKEYYRLAELTPNGRIRSISKEIERQICRIHMPAEGGGGGKFEVRPIVDESGHITELLFGSGSDLAGDDIDAIRDLDTVISVRTGYCPRGQ